MVGIADDDAHVLSVATPAPQCDDISTLLTLQPESVPCQLPASDFSQEQKKDRDILLLLQYLENKVLPQCTADARRIAAQSPLFTVDNHVLYYLDNKQPDIK